jgi:predicted Fe-Mo cluster-binding NifX family protein
MLRVAIPIFRARVSPVFDECTRVLFVDIENDREVERKEMYLDEFSLTERLSILQKSGVSTVICGGISDLLQNMLQSARISLIMGIAGEVDQVLTAFIDEGLDESRFQMPGFKRNREVVQSSGKEEKK